tara:strand:- start:126 stop:362 length:237 start_codon:yes stop_codon:yes gene_type:complete
MTYYLIIPEEVQINVPSVTPLGEVSFKNFWTESGWNILNSLIEQEPELAEVITVKDQSGKLLTIEQFLTKINGLKVIQ